MHAQATLDLESSWSAGQGIHVKISSAVRAHGTRVDRGLQFTLRRDTETV